MNRYLANCALGAGLAAIAWIALGYLGSHPLALAMSLLIGAFYLAGAIELQRFRRATVGLLAAIAALPDRLAALEDWIATLPPALRTPVRRRIETERAVLPGPTLTPYLVGLLVLLGMLGTFAGMAVTLDGAVLALQSTTDLAAMRAALAAPVKGLGLAFGTSVAGVAASAMLGLAAALLRRERLQAMHELDARSVTTLRPFSLAHQHERTLQTLQDQAQAMPALVAQIGALVQAMQQRDEATGARLLAAQDRLHEQARSDQAGLAAAQERFHEQARGSYAELAASVDRSLRDSLIESARRSGDAIRPLVESTLGGIASESAALQRQIGDAVTRQLDGMAGRFDTSVTAVADTWTRALAHHEQTSDALAARLQAALDAATSRLGDGTGALLAAIDARHAAAQADAGARLDETMQRSADLHARIADTAALQLDAVATRFAASADGVARQWHDALAEQQRSSDSAATSVQHALGEVVQTFAQRSGALLETLEQAHVRLRGDLAANDDQRLTAWAGALESVAGSLDARWQRMDERWQRTDERSTEQQRQICATLERTARGIHAEAQAQAAATIGEIARLIDAAAQAPRAAAEAIDLLHRKLAESAARDDDQLAERSRIMGTLDTLLGAINRAAHEQRDAIDALVASAAGALERAGAQFGERLDAEAGRIAGAAEQVAAGSVDVASFSAAFGSAVQLFADSSQGTLDQLQRIEAALDKAAARSDEQLAYYVAQARELVELSVSAQGRIVEDLQQLAARRGDPPLAEAA